MNFPAKLAIAVSFYVFTNTQFYSRVVKRSLLNSNKRYFGF